jgi:hypothetical protein
LEIVSGVANLSAAAVACGRERAVGAATVGLG